jgi:hypothetical protein
VEEKFKREQLNTWRFIVTKLEEIKKIIRIFDQYQLNSTKLLNFLNFKEAFEIYINSAKTPELVEKLEKIKSGMNSKRIYFQLPESHQYRITPY